MKIFNSEKHIADKILQNRITADASLILNNNSDVKHLAFACQGNACAMSALGGADWKITDDVMPISSILVTDIWNANGDLFTAEEIVKASETPIFKPINWMHRGSEDSENENIGVMVKSMLVSGDLPSIDFMNDVDKNNFLSSSNKTTSGKVHIKQDGLIWSQYFPSYAEKIKAGIEDRNLYVSMECFFEDFGYCLRKNEDDENIIYVDRNEETSHISDDLTAYGGRGYTKYNGKKYQVGRWLKNIIFSGQGIVIEPANKKKGKILSIIINNKSKAALEGVNVGSPNQQIAVPPASSVPFPTYQSTNSPLNPDEMQLNPDAKLGQPNMSQDPQKLADRANKPKTEELPADGLLFYSAKEAEKVGTIELGCTGSHLYQSDRHSDQPLLYAALMGDPTDLEQQMKVPMYRPCADERELRFILQELSKKGVTQLMRGGKIEQSQTTSFQPSVPGGAGDLPSKPSQYLVNTGNPQQGPFYGRGSDLDESNNLVYKKTRVNQMENLTEEKVVNHVDDAAKVIKDLSGENAQYKNAIEMAAAHINNLNKDLSEYERAVNEAAAHIQVLNQELHSYKDFAREVEVIADKAYTNKIGEDRLKEMQSIVGDQYTKADVAELASLDDKGYNALKNAVSKISKTIDKELEENERIKKAEAALKRSKFIPAKANMVLNQSSENKVNPAENLVGFTLTRKRK